MSIRVCFLYTIPEPKSYKLEAMKITVYSTPTCPFCKNAKQFLDDRNITYTDIDVSENHEKAQEMIQKSGQMGVPVIEIDGEIIVGFDENELKKALNP